MVIIIVLFQFNIIHKTRFTLVDYFGLLLNEQIKYLRISFLIYLNLVFVNLHHSNIVFHLHFLPILFIFSPLLLATFINITIFKFQVIFFLVRFILEIQIIFVTVFLLIFFVFLDRLLFHFVAFVFQKRRFLILIFRYSKVIFYSWIIQLFVLDLKDFLVILQQKSN